VKSRDIILGIDPGSLRTGFGIIDCSRKPFSHVTHGTIILNKNLSLSERLRDLALDLATIIDKYRPNRAVVEDVFLFNNPRSALILGQARGASLAILGLRGVPVESLSATRIKSLIAGHGQAKKFQIAHMVSLALNIEIPQSKDSSDALAVALALGHTNLLGSKS
jgi:crossover junction endodeoxyribonuclease RuvC